MNVPSKTGPRRRAAWPAAQSPPSTSATLLASNPASMSLVSVDGEQALLIQPAPATAPLDLRRARAVPTPTAPAPATESEVRCVSVLGFALAWGVALALLLAAVRFGLLPAAIDIAAVAAMVLSALAVELRHQH